MRSSRITACLWALCASVPQALTQQTYGDNYVETTQDSDIVAAAFPDVEGVDIIAPAFTRPETIPEGFSNGTSGPTDLFELDYFIRSLADRNDWISYKTADFKSEEGRSIPFLYLSSSSSSSAGAQSGVHQNILAANNSFSSGTNSTKLKVFIEAAIHGNEPAADQAALAFLGKLDVNQTYAASLLEQMDILLLPRYNVDGVAYFQRALASNLDGNREHIKLQREQSKNLKRIFSDFNPHIAIDLHEFTASTIFGGEYQHAYDTLIASGIHLNTRASIREYVENFLTPQVIGKRLESYGIRWGPYATRRSNASDPKIVLNGPATQPRSARNAFGLSQTIAFLYEERGIRLADQHFQRRVATALIKIEALLEYARDNSEGILSVVEGARRDFIESNDDIVVTDSPTANLTQHPWAFVDRRNGSVVELQVGFYETRPAVANLTRSRPEAYLIPATWFDVVDRLEALGLEVQTLEYEYRGTVEALNITSSTLGSSIYEGHVLNTVTTSAYQREVHLPVGSFVVSTRQQNAALAFVALEPENIDSYVAFNLVPLSEGDEYPIFRILA